MANHRVITIHHDRMTLSGVDGMFPIASYAATLRDVLAVATARAINVHVEVELAPNALIVCRRCKAQYRSREWAAATYFEAEAKPGLIIEIRRCTCGVDLTPEHTMLRPNLTSN